MARSGADTGGAAQAATLHGGTSDRQAARRRCPCQRRRPRWLEGWLAPRRWPRRRAAAITPREART
eukprot:96207-Alexandrium_andersonii.AAC.1